MKLFITKHASNSTPFSVTTLTRISVSITIQSKEYTEMLKIREETIVNMLQHLECLQIFSGTTKWYEISYDVMTIKAPST